MVKIAAGQAVSADVQLPRPAHRPFPPTPAYCVDGAKTAGELYGRALMVIAAEQHATRLVVPSSQRMPATRWSSHKDIAAKALKKLAGPHIPSSLSKLEQAVKRAHATYDTAEDSSRERQRAQRQPPEPEVDNAVDDELVEDLEEAA